MATTTVFSAVTVTVTATQQAVTTTVTGVAQPITDSIYYETWTAGMSTFGLFNTLVGLLLIGILGFNWFISVSLLNSTGAALSYGLAWIAYYGPFSTREKIVASVLADVFWLMQEASLSLYSFLIVKTIVRGRERTVYLCVFWFLELCICAMRMPIMVSRVILARHNQQDPPLQTRINRYHTGYFISIALCESWNAYFLLKKFYTARTRRKSISYSNTSGRSNSTSSSRKGPLAWRGDLYSQLARSSEIRLASLASIGILRAITYSWQVNAESATNTATQIDRFVASFETMFSTIFIVDVLASKLAFFEQRSRGAAAAAENTDPSSKEWAAKRHPSASADATGKSMNETYDEAITMTTTVDDYHHNGGGGRVYTQQLHRDEERPGPTDFTRLSLGQPIIKASDFDAGR